MSDRKVQDKFVGSEKVMSTKHGKKEDDFREKVSKKLCYVLRYGAIKEGLRVHEGGFVEFKELMALPLMKKHSEAAVLGVLEDSISVKGRRRFQMKKDSGKILVRAQTARCFEKNPCHEGTKVLTLFETSMRYVLEHLDDYDLDNFPDEYIISAMIHRLKCTKKLNNRSLRVLLVPTLESLNLDRVFLTEGTFKMVWEQCPNLRQLNLKDCGYIVQDALLHQLLMKLPLLESLTLINCEHLTDRGLGHVAKHGTQLKHLNLSNIRSFSGEAVLRMVECLPRLKVLDIFDVKMSLEARNVLQVLSTQRGFKFYLRSPLQKLSEKFVARTQHSEEETEEAMEKLLP